MITENSFVTGMNGTSYHLGTQIGVGGEGTVYAVQGSQLVAKIYKKVDPDHEGKLRYMVNHPIPRVVDQLGNPILNAAWPQDVIYDSSRSFVGYVMPRIENGLEIFHVEQGCTTPKAKVKFPNYTWRLNVLVARNLAASINILHNQGYVIGDMNCKNFLVNTDGSISLLDTDSIDMTDPSTGKHYKCCVGMEDYLPPELQGRNLRAATARFTTQTDNFALAVHIFQLLMNNYHPFSAKQTVVKGSSSANPKMDRIVEGKCPYLHNYPDLTIPVGAPKLEDILPDYIILNFRKTFDYTSANAVTMVQNRTTASQWTEALRRLLQECDSPNGLVHCQQDPSHYYLRSMGSCGMCRAKSRYTAHTGTTPVYTPPKPTPQPAQRPIDTFFEHNDFYITEEEARNGGDIAVYSRGFKEIHRLPSYSDLKLYPRIHTSGNTDDLIKCSDRWLQKKLRLYSLSDSCVSFLCTFFSTLFKVFLWVAFWVAFWYVSVGALDWILEGIFGFDLFKGISVINGVSFLSYLKDIGFVLPPFEFYPLHLEFSVRAPDGLWEWIMAAFLWGPTSILSWIEIQYTLIERNAIKNEIRRRSQM